MAADSLRFAVRVTKFVVPMSAEFGSENCRRGMMPRAEPTNADAIQNAASPKKEVDTRAE